MISITNITVSILSIFWGVFYLFNLYNIQTEATESIQIWGFVSLCLGLVNLIIFITSYTSKKRLESLKFISIFFNGFIQIIPIPLWIAFNDSIVGEYRDNRPNFHGSWLHSIPHIIILLMVFINIILILKNNKIQK